MELAKVALGSLLPKLGTLLTDEYMLQKGVRGEIRFLQAEMESMQAALNKVSEQPAHKIDDLHKIWARDLKELVCDIEDSVDTFMVRVDAPVSAKPYSFRLFLDRTMSLLTKITNRRHIADDIQDIKRRIHDVSVRRERYNFENIVLQPDNTAMDPRLPALYEDAKNLVGIDGPAKKLTALLLHGDAGEQKQQLLVVSIVGIGGLGKTTLASSVYHRLKEEFQAQAFVSVSLKPEIKKILSSILRQVSKSEYPNAEAWNDTELIYKIREVLEEKRYNIVIDDIWEESAWTQIKCCLVDNNLGSRVIVTTRNACVAKFCCSPIDGTMYELDPLSDTYSKRLFFQRTFNKDEEIHSELEAVSRKILKKCGGVPLAIITIASLLAATTNKTKYEWYNVYKSMGTGLEKDKTLKSMRGILYLSYSDLPSYLKPCLLYLSIFPEDYKIARDSLVRKWVAEGFVDGKHGKSLYEVGDRYFVELVNRSLIQPIDLDKNGSARGCRVHDMILDLIISLSMEENFITILEGPQLISPDCKIRRRRLSLQGSEVEGEQLMQPKILDLSHVRTLIGFDGNTDWVPPLSRFSVLRVLVLKCFPRKNSHPKDLRSLYHLRYLELGGKLETDLIEEIGKLQHLKTLDLCDASIRELPVRIVQLRQLERQIFINGRVNLEEEIRNLMSLQDLSMVNDAEASSNSIAELSKLTELRVLNIHVCGETKSYVKIFLKNLSNLGNIQALDFHGWCTTYSLDSMPDQWIAPAHIRFIFAHEPTICHVPRWFSSLTALSCLTIKVERLIQDDLRPLGALPVLRFLYLEVAFGGPTDKKLVIGTDRPFHSLEEFTFKHSTRCFLVFTPGVMPKLQRLKLYFQVLKRNGGVDIGMENLTSLEHVTVIGDCDGAPNWEVEDIENQLRHAIGFHPNNPSLEMSGDFEYGTVWDDDCDDRESTGER